MDNYKDLHDLEQENDLGKGYDAMNFAFLGTAILALIVFLIGGAPGCEKKPSKLENEIMNIGKAAQECLVKGDTLSANKYLIRGTQLADKNGRYDSYEKNILPLIDHIYESSFYDKETGSVIRGINVNKPAGPIEKTGYQHEWFPKESEKED